METVLLAKLLGPLFAAIGLGMLLDRKHYAKIQESALKSPALMYFGGILSLLLGVWILLHHNSWALSTVGLVTFVGWMATLKGVGLLLCPRCSLSLAKNFARNEGMMVVAGLVSLAVGGCLLWAGFDLGSML